MGLERTNMEIKEIGNNSCIVIKKKSFWDYAGNRQELMRLSPQDREKVFLRWKHGSKDHEANLSVELTDRYLLSRITDENLEKMNEYDKWFWTSERKWDYKCTKIKEEIGLVAKSDKTEQFLKSVKVGSPEQKTQKMFGGKVTEWEE